MTKRSPDGICRILVVEDNPHVAEIFRYAFQRIVHERLGEGIEVRMEEAGDGNAAWVRLEASASEPVGYALVVLDLMLPVLDGIEVLARMRALAALAEVPVLVITASDHESMDEARELGATEVLPKPVQLAQIREAVSRILG